MQDQSIHETFPDENENFNDDASSTNQLKGDVEETRQNFATGIPEIDPDTIPSKKKGMALTIGLTVFGVLVVFFIAIFFILRGNPKNQEAVVKDNSAKSGVNSNTSGNSAPDFQSDYQNRYGSNANNTLTQNNPAIAANSNAANNPGINSPYGSVGNNVTAPPPPLGSNNMGIYQAPSANPSPSPTSTNSTQTGNSSFNPGRNSSGETTRVKPNRNIELAEGTKGDATYRNASNGGGRNEQVSLFFYDRTENAAGNKTMTPIAYELAAPVKPTFGTVLPVRVLGRLHTLGTNGLARMELTRTVEGKWGSIPSGTLFVGRISGGEGNRIFVSLIGYIDSRSNRLVTLGGDLQGIDGALGMEGEVKQLGSRWAKTFSEVLNSAKEIGSAYLLGRAGGNGTVINTGQLQNIPNALDNKEATKFVIVPAGANGYIVLNDLPPAVESTERGGAAPKKLTDEEILKLIQTNSRDDIQKLMPKLSEDGKQIARVAMENN